MHKNDQIQTIIDKYLHGTATEGEIDQLNSWYYSFDDTKVELEDHSYRDMMKIKKQMLSGINTGKRKSQLFSITWKVAASIAMILTFGFVVRHYISQSTRAEEVSLIEKSNPIGRKSTITLPDGSKVKLNSDSKIKYNNRFSENNRVVTLEGEAFFEVVKDKNRPFIVRTGDVSTRVLGTSFNVSAYEKSSLVEVAVLTGKVAVRKEGENNSGNEKIAYLTPNMKATYDRSEKKLQTYSFNMEETLGWKDGLLVFKNADQNEIAVKLKRWYGVELTTVEDNGAISKRYTGKFKNKSLEFVLKAISYTSDISFEIDNNKVIQKHK